MIRGCAVALAIVANSGCTGGDPPAWSTNAAYPTSPSTTNSVRVSGRALDFVTGVGVPGASVVFGKSAAVTDAAGAYSLAVQMNGDRNEPVVDGVFAGVVHATGATYRGDFLVRSGTCVTRYGTVASARTLLPIAGAKVSLLDVSATTAAEGWYRIDLGCSTNGLVGSNTMFMSITHPNYQDASEVAGRGVYLTERRDIQMLPR